MGTPHILFQFRQSFEPAPQDIWLKATIGAAGAVTLSAWPESKGVTSITKESTAGQYTIVLDKKYPRLLACDATIVAALADSGIPAAPVFGLLSTTDITAGSIVVQFANGSLSATNLTSGSVIHIHITVASNLS